MEEVNMGMGKMGVRFLEAGREWRLPGFLHSDGLVLCGESEEELRVIIIIRGVSGIRQHSRCYIAAEQEGPRMIRHEA